VTPTAEGTVDVSVAFNQVWRLTYEVHTAEVPSVRNMINGREGIPDCYSICYKDYEVQPGTEFWQVHLDAHPAPGSTMVFEVWNPACAGGNTTGTCTLKITGDVHIVGTFHLKI
jgi:hypothetical protein